MKAFAVRLFILTLIMLITSIESIRGLPNQSEPVPMTTVKSVDLKKYAGTWYEISKIPNRFQRQCTGNTTAEYVIRSDGRIGVTNRCKKQNGDFAEAKGIAEIADPISKAKLKVSFVHFLWRWWFWGDYWIIGLGKAYDYAIVGTPGRKYGWVLSRTPTMDSDQYESVMEELKAQGYNPGDFVKTRH
jgi:apolipoprotein D and lipocalin family protein